MSFGRHAIPHPSHTEIEPDPPPKPASPVAIAFANDRMAEALFGPLISELRRTPIDELFKGGIGSAIRFRDRTE